MQMKQIDYKLLELNDSAKKDFDAIYTNEKSITVIKELKQETFSEWEETKFFTAGYIQNRTDKLGFSDPNIIWDIYIIFYTYDDIPLEIISKIEKDKFCCKKYVLKLNVGETIEDGLIKNIPLFADFSKELISSDGRGGIKNTSKNIAKKIDDKIMQEYFIHNDINMNKFKFMAAEEVVNELQRRYQDEDRES